MADRLNDCSKVCWDLLELTELQMKIIKNLTMQVKELEALLQS